MHEACTPRLDDAKGIFFGGDKSEIMRHGGGNGSRVSKYWLRKSTSEFYGEGSGSSKCKFCVMELHGP